MHRALRGGSDSAFQNSIPSTSLSFFLIFHIVFISMILFYFPNLIQQYITYYLTF